MQDYDIALAKYVADLGVDEIQFDYVRFPAEGDQQDAMFVFQQNQEPKSQESVILTSAKADEGPYLSLRWQRRKQDRNRL